MLALPMDIAGDGIFTSGAKTKGRNSVTVFNCIFDRNFFLFRLKLCYLFRLKLCYLFRLKLCLALQQISVFEYSIALLDKYQLHNLTSTTIFRISKISSMSTCTTTLLIASASLNSEPKLKRQLIIKKTLENKQSFYQ